MKKRILTGDRPTGKLHLGHFVGSLQNRLKLQDEYEVYLLVADLHALTTNQDTSKMKENIRDLVIDQLSVGLDPDKVTFCLQSGIPEDQEIATIFSMLVSVNRLERVPTLKETIRDLKIANVTLGLLSYPVLQSADILMLKANLVPVGKDQKSHVELTREISREFNSTYGNVLPIPDSLIPQGLGTLPGIDGKMKMGKSLGNAILLSDDEETVNKKVMSMYTDPERIHSTDPGKVEGNPVFIYLDAFGVQRDRDKIDELKSRYKKGEVGDVEVKKFLTVVLNNFLSPIRERRKDFEKREDYIDEILEKGTQKAREIAKVTLSEMKRAMQIG